MWKTAQKNEKTPSAKPAKRTTKSGRQAAGRGRGRPHPKKPLRLAGSLLLLICAGSSGDASVRPVAAPACALADSLSFGTPMKVALAVGGGMARRLFLRVLRRKQEKSVRF